MGDPFSFDPFSSRYSVKFSPLHYAVPALPAHQLLAGCGCVHLARSDVAPMGLSGGPGKWLRPCPGQIGCHSRCSDDHTRVEVSIQIPSKEAPYDA